MLFCIHAVSFLVLWQKYLREEHDASVSHGEGQAQDAAAHDGVAQVEDGHPEGGVAGMLLREKMKRDLSEKSRLSTTVKNIFKSAFEIKSLSGN